MEVDIVVLRVVVGGMDWEWDVLGGGEGVNGVVFR